MPILLSMSLVPGINLASALAGTQQAEKIVARDTKRQEQTRKSGIRRGRDEQDLSVAKVETAEAVRQTTGNDQEETHSDRQAHAGYTAAGAKRARAGAAPPSIDVRG